MTARRFLRRAAVLVPAVLLAGGLCAPAQQPGRDRASPGGALFVAQQDAARRAIERQVYDQLLLRDRRSRLLLERARRELETGDAAGGLELIQQLLDRPDDVFVWIDDLVIGDRSRLSSLRTEVNHLLTGSGRDVVETYQRLYGPEADRLLLDARRTGSADRFHEVARRFFHTQAGFEATDWLAARWLDHGQYATAARAWSRLNAETVHQSRVTREIVAKTALAWHLAGDSDKARQAMDSLQRDRVRIGGRDVSAEGWLAGLPAASDAPGGEPPNDWPMYLGSPERVQSVRATAPYPQPVWSVSFQDGQPRELQALLQQWERLQAANLQPTAVAAHPLVVDGLAVVRDWAGVRAFDLGSGRPAWSYRSPTSLAQAGRRKSVFDAAYERRGLTAAPSGQPDLNMQHAFAENSLHGTLATDGERVYAVELPDVRWPRSMGRFPNTAVNDRTRSANRLIALPVRPALSADGSLEPVWAVGGPVPDNQRRENTGPAANSGEPSAAGAGGPRASPRDPQSLAGYFFLGPPLPLDGRLYGLAEEGRELKLVVLEAHTGRPLWTQSLAGVDLSIEEDLSRYFRACVPSFARGVLVCPTGHGLLIALDPFDGTFLWSRFCGDATVTGQPVNRRGGVVSRVDDGHAGFNAAPHIRGWRVLYLPHEADAVFCLDLVTGNVHWTAPREDGEYIGAITDGVVLVVGKEFCRGLALGTGAVRWETRHGTPAGRGLDLGDRYLLPLDDGRVAAIDLATGREIGNSHVVLAGRLKSVLGSSSLAASVAIDEDELAADATEAIRKPGNLVAAAGMIVSVGPRGMAVFRETGALRNELHERLRQRPDSPGDQLLAAELELMQGRLDAAEALLLSVLEAESGRDDRLRAESLLRELLYLRLDESDNADEILARLEPLSQSRTDRARFVLRRSELALIRRDAEAALDSVRELAGLEPSDLLPDLGEPHRRLSAARWARSIAGRLAEALGEDGRPIVQARIAAERDAALEADGVGPLERFLAVWSGWPEAAEARSALAERYADRGRLHEAELLLLEARNHPDPAVAADGTRRLAILWDSRGLSHDAAGLLD
ncbi:MAG TPA: PQQ-binding-like beta-propeller repeat protein, partial [Planctomycetaceae bacterium]|nr:PQQ-binding-like beta-propeller repeat protein [Planctomycetaceae bacterium]